VSAAIPRYVLAPEGVSPEIERALAPLVPYTVVHSVEDLLGGVEGETGPEPGWVILPPGSGSDEVLDLLLRLTGEAGDWSPLAVLREGDAHVVAPIHPGHRFGIEDVGERLGGASTGAGLLSFRLGVGELSRIRHDINNPLTAALAEVQLLLMDAEAGTPTTEALEVVESQLQRIRQLAARLTVFRTPRS